MAGLLDRLQADDTIKDEFGLTQAERRQPLWSGLIKAGLLGVAGGGEMMPADRARTIGQIGGAIADIPSEMMQYRSGAAQQALRGQQVREGKDKLAQREKVRALAATPEFQNDLKNLPPHVQQIIKLQIEAGDMDAVSRTMANASAQARQVQQDALSQKREDRLAGHQDTEEKRRQEQFEWQKKEAERKAKEAGTFGSGTTGQVLDILTNGDPASKEYYTAYNHYLISNSRPTVDKDGNVTHAEPDMKRFRPPTYNPNALPPPPPPAGAPPPSVEGSPVITPPPEPTASPTGGKTVRVDQGVVPQKPTALGPEQLAGITSGLNILDQIDQLNHELDTKPNIKVGTVANQILNRAGSGGVTVLDRMDPEGVKARALIAGLTANKLKALSGTAASDREVDRLIALMPQPTDDPPTVREKLKIFQKEFDQILKAHHTNLKGTKANIPEELEKRYGGGGGGDKVRKYNPDTKKLE